MKSYAVRYSVEPWNKPVPSSAKGPRARPGITVSTNDYGYTDLLFLASILEDGSVLLLSSEQRDEGRPSRALLERIRDQINHQLEHHADE